MTGTEFEAKRKGMGYSRKQLGAAMATSHRNIENWELGMYTVPRMAGRMLGLLSIMHAAGTALLRDAGLTA